MIDSEIILRDFATFCDPATEPAVKEGQNDLDVILTREAEEIRFTVNRSSGIVTLRSPTVRRFPSTSALLADVLFANIRTMSATQRQINAGYREEDYIDPEGVITQPSADAQPLSIDKLDNLLIPANLPERKARVVLLDGQAGVGKTSLIHRLLVHRAHTPTSPPVIHVISRGSRLFGLNQLLAAALDTLRAKFTFDQAPVLIRHKLIVIAIDGFDELVDSEGYSDSWAALGDFLSEIGPGGGVILAGRDTFFDQQIFRDRLGNASEHVDLVNARLTPIRPQRARWYLMQHGWSESELASGPGGDVLREGSYVLRPYFLRNLAEASVKDWSSILGGMTLRSYLVENFLRREAELVCTRTSLTEELAVERLREVFMEIALEMAASETSAVDTAFIELVVEMVFDNDIAPIDMGRLKYKSGSLGFMENDVRAGYRRFPHTEVSNHFLAQGIIRGLSEPTVRRVLRRASLETDFFSTFSEVFGELDDETAASFVSNLRELGGAEGFSQDRLTANLKSLEIGTLSWQSSENRMLSDAMILDTAIVGAVSKARLERIAINRFDARGSDMRQVEFIDCSAYTLIADENTTFGETSPEVAHLQIVKPSGMENIRGPSVRDWIEQHSVEEGRSWSEPEELLWRVIHTLRRRYAIRDSRDDPAGKYLRDPLWKEIERILERENRIVRDQSRDASGPNDTFVRIRDPIGLISNEDESTLRIWSEVAALA